MLISVQVDAVLKNLPPEDKARSKVTFNVAKRNRNKPVIGKLSKQKEEEALNQVCVCERERQTETVEFHSECERFCC